MRRRSRRLEWHVHHHDKLITEDRGIKLENVKLADLGRTKRIAIDKDNTTIVEGYGKSADIEDRVKMIRSQVEESTSDYDKKKLQERLAKIESFSRPQLSQFSGRG